MKKYMLDKDRLSFIEELAQPFAVYQFVDKRVVTLALSKGFCKLFGYDNRTQAYYDMDHDMYKDTHPDDAVRIANIAIRFATEGGEYDVVYRTRSRDGGYTVVHAQGEHVYTDDGVRLAHIWYTDEGAYEESITQNGFEMTGSLSRALHEQSMIKSSQYDFLTGLPSMTYFFELAEAGIHSFRDNGDGPMLLYIDLGGMKFFNAKHGFVEGDKMLRAFARLLVLSFNNENSCRIGADHFAAIAGESGLEEKLSEIFRKFGDMYGGKTPAVHVGIYPYRMEDIPISSACDRAKLACTSLRGSYSSGYSYYNDELREETLQKQYVIENFDTALREKWIQVYLQPIIRTVNGKVCDVEALARWIDPEKGILSPAAFIPVLEETGLIYKLDLYMLDQVLDSIRMQIEEGFYVVPHSINLSRSDFEQCDIVEEFRRRVDAAGIPRDRITIEITESIIGRDFEFMREQVRRFQSLGFPVWMDDFGSGYSSLDVLQSIRFDLIKFDMSFMRKLDAGDDGKVILTELMRMATSLGVDTVCEGVETETQVRFLQEIGCSKLQGYFYSKPVSFDTIREKRRNGTMLEHENSKESGYYEYISRVNLFDLGVIASEDQNSLRKTFETIPIAVLEVKDGNVRYIRTNRSYQEYVKEFFNQDILLSKQTGEEKPLAGYGKTFASAVEQCCHNGNSVFFDEQLPDGSVIHSFARRICVNPVKGRAAVVLAVLSISERDDSTTYADIARALAADYYNIYVIDLDTNDYIEYSSHVGDEELSIERHGVDFFESAKRDTLTRIYEEDREQFLGLFTKENVIRDLDAQGVFTTTYRLIDFGTPVYVNMKITRMQGGNRIILGISIIDAHMKQMEEAKRLGQEKKALGRIAALSPNYIVLYLVDPVTEHYTLYNPSSEYASIGLASQGETFFKDVILDAPKAIHPDDLENHLRIFTKNNMMRKIKEDGAFEHYYRLRLDGEYIPVSLRATLFEEDDGEKILMGVVKDDDRITRRRLAEAYVRERNNSLIFTHIAQALARGSTDLYYVNIETDELIEYHTDDELGVLTEARRGNDFFEGCKRDAKLFVHPEDQARFVEAMDPAYIKKALEQSSTFEVTYRRIIEDKSFYVMMKVSRVEDDRRFIVISVSDIDELMKKRQAEERMQEERVVYARLHALTGNFICVYVVDPETDHYHEFSATDVYSERFAQAKEGVDFFGKVRGVARQFNHPKDMNLFLTAFTKENILAEIERSGIFTLGYRLMMEGKPVHVQMKAAMVEEREGLRLIVGLNDIDVQVRQEEEFGQRLTQALSKAEIDALTGVKNKHAYVDAENRLNHQIDDKTVPPFAIVVLDVNDLKKVNDSEGHQAGDQYLRDACKIICTIFKHSPVFRIGGDEFAVISQGVDYENIEERVRQVNDHNVEGLETGGIVIACGMARYENDSSVTPVFERADNLMYEDKKRLKERL